MRLSGTARLDLKASLSTTQSNLGVLVVDYSATPFPMVTRNGEGIANTTTRTCWGATSDGTPCTIGDTCTASHERSTRRATSRSPSRRRTSRSGA